MATPINNSPSLWHKCLTTTNELSNQFDEKFHISAANQKKSLYASLAGATLLGGLGTLGKIGLVKVLASAALPLMLTGAGMFIIAGILVFFLAMALSYKPPGSELCGMNHEQFVWKNPESPVQNFV